MTKDNNNGFNKILNIQTVGGLTR